MGVDHGVQVDPADTLEEPTMKVSAESSWPGRSLSTCRSRKQGFSFSRNAACSGLSSIAALHSAAPAPANARGGCPAPCR